MLKFLITNKETINNRNVLSKYFTRRRLFISDNNIYDNMDKLKKVRTGGDILSNIHHRRIRDFITRLYRKTGKDYRPKIIKNEKNSNDKIKRINGLLKIFGHSIWKKVYNR